MSNPQLFLFLLFIVSNLKFVSFAYENLYTLFSPLPYWNFQQQWTPKHPSFNSKIKNAEKVKQVVMVMLVVVK
jgi:hypothetical protein